MAEFQLPGFFSDFIHREVHDPAEGILLLVHVFRTEKTKLLDQGAHGFLRSDLLSGGQSDKRVGFQTESCYHLILLFLEEFCNSADQFTLLIHSEPIRFIASNHFNIGTQFVDLFARAGHVAHRHSFDRVAFKRTKSDVAHQFCDILGLQIDTKVRLVRSVGFHGFHIRDSLERSS